MMVREGEKRCRRGSLLVLLWSQIYILGSVLAVADSPARGANETVGQDPRGGAQQSRDSAAHAAANFPRGVPNVGF